VKWRIGAVLIVTALFLVLALWGIDVEHAIAALGETDWWLVAGGVACYPVVHVLRAGRLGLLLGGGVPFWRLFSINTVGFLAINVVPLRLGEAVRPWLLAEREGVSWGRAIAAIVLERLLDMLMLLLMLFGLAWVVDLPPGGVLVQGVDVVRAGQIGAGVIVALGSVFGAAIVLAGEPALQLLERLPQGARIGGLARRFREGFVALARDPKQALGGVVYSLAIWAVTVFAVFVTMSGFPGLPATLASAWTTWSITIAGMAAVPTAGFFGVYEVCCTAALSLWSVDDTLARTFAVVLHLGQFGFIVGLGAVFLVVEGLTLKDLVVRPNDAD
jgi:glycosyltransferase 2 family protein